MKLLSKPEAQNKLRRDNEELVKSNIRLRDMEKEQLSRLNTIKDDYRQDKVARLEDYERFCKDLEIKRAKLLQEYAQLEKLVEQKKELYYSLVTKQDALEELRFQVKEREERVALREKFVEELEEKQKDLTT